MFNLKKKSIIVLLIVFVLSLIGMSAVEAKPFHDTASLKIVVDEEHPETDKYLYDATGTYTIETTLGASYDVNTNTLTLNGYNGKTIVSDNMNDLKINVIGENTITYDSTSFGMLVAEGTVEIIGTGTLNFVENNITSLTPTNDGALAGVGSSIIINGPTINIDSLSSGIVANTDVVIKNSKVNINTTGDYGIYSHSPDSEINIVDSEVNCISSKYGLLSGNSINIDGKSKVTVKTTLDDEEAITIYAKGGEIILTTEESVIIEKASNGKFCLPEIALENETLDTLYKYDVINETNKRIYTGNKTKKTLMDLVEIDGTSILPVIGEVPKYLSISSDEYEMLEQDWFDEDGESITKFEEGKEYYYEITLKPKSNYYFSDLTKANISGMDETECLYRDETTSMDKEEIRKYNNI